MNEPLSIGIVLPEDRKHRISMVLPAGTTFTVSAGQQTFTVAGGRAVAACVLLSSAAGDGPCLALELRTDPPVRLQGESLTVAPKGRQELARGQGILLLNVVVGRLFHWRKEVDQTLPGTLQFHRAGESIVVVNEVDIDTYLAGTVAAEMSPDCPLDFLKAQAVSARSWCFANRVGKHGGLFSLCNDDCCQRYRGTGDLSAQVIRAVTETRGMLLTNSGGEVLNAQYSKCCGGILSMTSLFRGNATPSLWRASRRMLRRCLPAARKAVRVKFDAPAGYGGADFPLSEQDARRWITEAGPNLAGLFCGPKSVPPAVLPHYLSRADEEGPSFRWAVAAPQDDLGEILRTHGGIQNLSIVTALDPLERDPSGRISRLRVQYFDDGQRPRSREIRGEHAIRRALSRTFLLSSAFVVEESADRVGAPSVFRLQGAGWGHGVGLCQIGALGMALQGYSYENILSHYYENATLDVLAWAS